MELKVIDEQIKECLQQASCKNMNNTSPNTDFNKEYRMGQQAAYTDVRGLLQIAKSANIIKMYLNARKVEKELNVSDMIAMTVSIMTIEYYDPNETISGPLLDGMTIQQARQKLLSDLSNMGMSVEDVVQKCLDVLNKITPKK